MRNLSSSLLLVAATLLPLPAHAEPVRITSGFLESTFFGGVRMRLVGEGFDASGSIEGFPGPATTCAPCNAGDVVNLGWFITGPSGGGSATVDGTVFPIVSFGGTLDFTSVSVIMPPPSFGDFTVTGPFAFNAHLFGSLIDQPLFERMLIGRGTVTASFQRAPAGLEWDFEWKSVRYDFASPEPIPEPSTLLLFGTGCAAALRFRKRRGV